MPRTTLDIDASILHELRRRGERERKSLGRVASELLARALDEPDDPARAPRFRWITADLGVPLIDLEDKDAVQDAVDQPS